MEKRRSIEAGEEERRDTSRWETKRSRIWSSAEWGRVARESWIERGGKGFVDSKEERRVLGSSAFSSFAGVGEGGEESSEEKR